MPPLSPVIVWPKFCRKEFPTAILQVLVGVMLVEADEGNKTGPDRGDLFSGDGDGCGLDSLNDKPHCVGTLNCRQDEQQHSNN
mmetsp:Transcript_5414/g.9204  ORF Transcript_5414/g.9204 Transcript_5414/m.9204 type:complete len:83 (+) Transcript_5414:768-1016(+)